MGSKAGRAPFHCGGFSLVEMLVVLAVVAIMGAFAMLGLNSVLEGSRIEQAGRMILDEINLGRQTAVARNRNVEVRFIKKSRSGRPESFCGIQTGWIANDGTFHPSGPAVTLPEGILLSALPERSSLLAASEVKTNDAPVYRYVPLIMKPSGFVEPHSGITLRDPWFVTATRERDEASAEIKDFITVQIDPWTSRPTFYRP